MKKTDDKIQALLSKHPNLTKEDAIKILAEKNERKKKKRADKEDRSTAKKLKAAKDKLSQSDEIDG
jgi:hypothetical protein